MGKGYLDRREKRQDRELGKSNPRLDKIFKWETQQRIYAERNGLKQYLETINLNKEQIQRLKDLKQNAIEDIVGKQYRHLNERITKEGNTIEHSFYDEYSKEYYGQKTDINNDGSVRTYSTKRHTTQYTGEEIIRGKIDKQSRVSPRGRGILQSGVGLAGLITGIGALRTGISTLYHFISGDSAKAKKSLGKFALLGGARFALKGVNRNKAIQGLGGKGLDTAQQKAEDNITDSQKAKEKTNNFFKPTRLINAFANPAYKQEIPLAMISDACTFDSSGKVIKFDRKKLYNNLKLAGKVGLASNLIRRVNNSQHEQDIIYILNQRGIDKQKMASTDPKKGSIKYYINLHQKDINDAYQIAEDVESDTQDPFHFSEQLQKINISEEKKKEIIKHVTALREKFGEKAELEEKNGELFYHVHDQTIKLNVTSYPTSFSSKIGNKRYPLEREIYNIEDLIYRANKEARIIKKFSNKESYLQNPFYKDGDSIYFDKKAFKRSDRSTRNEQDPVYEDSIITGLRDKEIPSLEKHVQYYTDRLNRIIPTKLESGQTTVKQMPQTMMTNLIESIYNIKGSIHDFTTNSQGQYVITLPGGRQLTVEETREKVKAGRPGYRTGKGLAFTANGATQIGGTILYTMGTNIRELFHGLKHGLSNNQLIKLVKSASSNAGDVIDAWIEGGKLKIKSAKQGVVDAGDWVYQGKLGKNIGYGTVKGIKFLGHGIVEVAGIGLRNIRDVFVGGREALTE